MSTHNGIGTMFYGWKHAANGESTATQWATIFYVPVLALGRYRLRVLTDFEREKFVSSGAEALAALGGNIVRTDNLEILERLPFDVKEMASTYLKTYLVLPLLMSWPFFVLKPLIGHLLRAFPEWRDSPAYPVISTAIAVALLVNAVSVPMWAIQRARGYKGGFFGKSRP